MKKFMTTLIVVSMLASVNTFAAANSNTSLHIVQKGDKLWSIAQKYNVSVSDIISSNKNLKNPDNITIGTTICIPNNNNQNNSNNNNQNNSSQNNSNNNNQNNSSQNNSNSQDNNSSVSSYEKQVVELVNKERAKNGLSPLKLNAKVSDVAREKSQDMKNKGYFNHTSPTYGSPFDMLKKFGVTYKTAGENIAKGQKTPEAVVQAWMNSEGHRKNILNKNYTEIGVGYVSGGSSTYWTQMFIG